MSQTVGKWLGAGFFAVLVVLCWALAFAPLSLRALLTVQVCAATAGLLSLVFQLGALRWQDEHGRWIVGRSIAENIAGIAGVPILVLWSLTPGLTGWPQRAIYAVIILLGVATVALVLRVQVREPFAHSFD